MVKNRFGIKKYDGRLLDNNCIGLYKFISGNNFISRFIDYNLFGIKIRKIYGE